MSNPNPTSPIPATPTASKIAERVLNELGPRVFAVTLGLVYVLGFLVVNAHLNKYGISDLSIINVQFIAAGALYTFFLLIFYLFGGRGILFSKKWINDHLDFFKKNGATWHWNLLIFIHSYVHLVFLLCLSAGLFSFISFGGSETFFFYAFLGIMFLIDYTFDVLNLDIRYPKIHLIIQFAIKLPAIVIFFKLAETSKPITVFFSYLVMTFYLNFILDHFERYKKTSDLITFSIINMVIFFLASALSFGVLIYGNMSHKIGGGQSIEASIALKDEYLDLFKNREKVPSKTEVKVIYLTDKYLFIEVDGQTIRIPESSVKWLKFNKPSLGQIPQSLIPEPNKAAKTDVEKPEGAKR